MDTCPACNATFTEPTSTGLCPACESDDTPAQKPTMALIALGVAAIPFFASFASTSTRSITVNGVSESTITGMDYVAVGAGAVGALLGLFAAVTSLKAKNTKGAAIAAAAVLLGAYQIARGLFLF